MSKLNVHWKHTAWSDDAGTRTSDETSDSRLPVTHTGVLSDDYSNVSGGQPVLVESTTNRIYQVSDLPPDTRIFISDISRINDPLVQNAIASGFEIAAEA